VNRKVPGARPTPLLLVCVLLLVGSGASEAQEPTYSHRAEASLGGAMTVVEQPYLDVKASVIPVPWINWRSGRLHLDGITAGYDVLQNRNYSASLVIQPRFDEVSPDDSAALSGIRARSMSADGGVSVARRYHGMQFSLSAVHDVLGKSHGSILTADVSWPMRFSRSSLILTTGVDWVDSKSTAYYFGVSPAEAGPLRPAYSPASAFNPHLGLFYFRPLGQHWEGVVGLRYAKLGRAIANSPIVSSDHSAIALIGAAYDFGASPR
jgi:MipA family protein